MRIILGLMLVLLSPLALAQNNIFTIPNMDQSVLFLSELFGQVGSVIGGATNGPLQEVILLFNNIALIIGGFVILYALVVSTLNTAHDGELLGKNWKSAWIPIRMSAGFALLLPVKAGGYALVQVFIMWLVVQGVGAADYVWSQYLKNVQEGNATPQVPYISQQVMTSVVQVFKNATCTLAYAAQQSQSTVGSTMATQTAPSIIYPPANSTNGAQITFGVTNPNQPTICGTLNLNDVPPPPSAVNASNFNTGLNEFGRNVPYTAQGVALGSQALNTFQNYGTYGALDAQYAYQRAIHANQVMINMTQSLNEAANFYVNTTNYCSDNTDLTCISEVQRQIINAGENYSSQASGASAPILNSNNDMGAQRFWQAASSNASVAVMADINQAKSYGWLYAGSYYILLSKITAETTPNVSAPKVNAPNLSSISDYASSPPYNYTQQITKICANQTIAGTTSVTSAGRLTIPCIPQDLNTAGPAASLDVTYVANNGTGILSPLIGSINSIFEDIFNWFIQVITSTSSNPVVALATMGQSIVLAVAAGFMGMGALVVAINAGTAWIPFAGSDISSTIEIALDIFIIPAMGLLGLTMGFAAMVGYYLPLIPYILFTAGALAWLILVIEAMVAGPILALGIVHPEGQHQVWGKAEQGIMLLVGIFLRPALMIIGFIAASLLVYVAFQMLNGGFKVAIAFKCLGIWAFYHVFYPGHLFFRGHVFDAAIV